MKLKLKVFDLRVGTLVNLYGWRLRRHGVQELMAGTGIAIGVALLFGVLVANSSITDSSRTLVHQIVGSARLELSARSSDGIDATLAGRVATLPGVQDAAPILRENAAVAGPKGRQLVQLIGVTPGLVRLGGLATRNLGAGTSLIAGGLGLPGSIASAIGAHGGGLVTVLSNGRAKQVLVRAVLGNQIVGSVANSPVAIALLPIVQGLTGKRGRVTQVLVRPLPGADARVAAELARLAPGRLDVEPADHELALLKEAAKPNSQSTTLFAAISAMVGFLLALNAMLLTVPERRRFVAELRTQGFDPRQVLLVLGSQAAFLGLVASAVGVLAGDVLSRTVFHQVPSYLTFAFPIGSGRIVNLTTVLLALGCGVLATLIASLPPALDLRSSQPVDVVLRQVGEAGQTISARTIAMLSAIGVAITLAVTAIVLIVPSLTVIGGVLLALAAFFMIPAVFVLLAWVLTPLSERIHGSMLALAVVELRATATRSIALAGVAALAVYGSVAIQGARGDLTHGLDAAIVQYLNTADIWVSTGDNVFTTDSFQANGAPAAISRAPGVASVRTYQGGLLDVGVRRLWIRARPPSDSAMLQSSQMIKGDLVRASAEIRQGGWVAISAGFASEHHLHLGSHFQLPTPSGPAPFGVAAITTNVGWPSGAITLSSTDYTRYWNTTDPAALEVNLKPGVTPAAGKQAVQAALGDRPGLWVQTSAERETQFKDNARQALRSLNQISVLLLLAAALAVASALSAAIWQRRGRLASLKAQGFDRAQLWRALLLESSIVLGIGCADGVIFGLYGHALADRWLKLTTGFPAPFSLGLAQVFLTLVAVAGIALGVIAIPGFSAAQVAPQVSFQE